MSLPKERAQFSDRFIEKLYQRNVARFVPVIDEKIAENRMGDRQGKMKIVRLKEDRLTVTYERGLRTNEPRFLVEEDYGDVGFIYSREGSGVKRTLFDIRSLYPLSEGSLSSRMLSAEETERLIRVMVQPRLISYPDSSKIMAINLSEQGLLKIRGIDLSRSGRRA